MAVTKLIRRPAWATLPAFRVSSDLGLMRNRLRNFFDEPLFRALDEPVPDEMLPEPVGWYPVVDVSETPTEYMFSVEVPGLKRSEVKILWEADVLTIRGEKVREKKTTADEAKYHLFERSYGAFQRSFTIPEAVVPEQITAELADGVLTVRVPRAPNTAASAKSVEIKVK